MESTFVDFSTETQSVHEASVDLQFSLHLGESISSIVSPRNTCYLFNNRKKETPETGRYESGSFAVKHSIFPLPEDYTPSTILSLLGRWTLPRGVFIRSGRLPFHLVLHESPCSRHADSPLKHLLIGMSREPAISGHKDCPEPKESHGTRTPGPTETSGRRKK